MGKLHEYLVHDNGPSVPRYLLNLNDVMWAIVESTNVQARHEKYGDRSGVVQGIWKDADGQLRVTIKMNEFTKCDYPFYGSRFRVLPS